MQEIYAGADQARADRSAHSSRSRTAGVTACASVTPQRTEEPDRRASGAELDILVIQGTVVSAEHVSKHGRATEPQGVHPRARHPGHRRWLRLLPGRAAPDADRCRRRAGRCRTRSRLHHPRRARTGCSAGHGHRRCPGRSYAAPRRDRRVRPRHRRRRHGHRRRHRQGDRLRRRCRHDRLAARRGRRGARSRQPLGDGHVPSHPSPGRPRAGRRSRHPRGDPAGPGPRERRPAQPVRCAAHRRWPPAATSPSRSSRRPR